MTERHDLTDAEIAALEAPPFWKRWGLYGPVIIAKWIGANAKRIAVFVAGSMVCLAGVAMLVLPGPGIVVIFAGLAILGTEFVWAERALDTAKAKAGQAGSAVTGRFRRKQS
ncbi:MAG: PGPGW domain-containing protein [Ilumatobacteraceae bacterium]